MHNTCRLSYTERRYAAKVKIYFDSVTIGRYLLQLRSLFFATLSCCLGDRAFAVAAPRIRNGLSLEVRNEANVDRFKQLLKTHYFKLTFF